MKNPSDHEYDRLMRELATESSLVYASERTETQEEVELKKQKVLRKELLSKEKRMTVFSDEDDDDDGDGDDDLDGTVMFEQLEPIQNSLVVIFVSITLSSHNKSFSFLSLISWICSLPSTNSP